MLLLLFHSSSVSRCSGSVQERVRIEVDRMQMHAALIDLTHLLVHVVQLLMLQLLLLLLLQLLLRLLSRLGMAERVGVVGLSGPDAYDL